MNNETKLINATIKVQKLKKQILIMSRLYYLWTEMTAQLAATYTWIHKANNVDHRIIHLISWRQL